MGADGASLGRGPRARAMNGPRRPVLSLPRCMAALLTFCRQHLLEAFCFHCVAGSARHTGAWKVEMHWPRAGRTFQRVRTDSVVGRHASFRSNLSR